MKYRLVYFTPDPFRGDRFVVGAMVGTEAGAKFERAHHVPEPECLGGRDYWVAMQMALDTLTAQSALDVDRGVASQLISLGDAKAVPPTVDAAAWVRATFFSRWQTVRLGRQLRSTNEEHRSVYGKRFFERWNVGRYIKNGFDLAQYGRLPEGLPELPHKPTHWVKGRDTVLLMEPIIGTRQSLEADLKLIGSSMLAQLKLFELARVKARPEMIAYVFPNGYRNAMSDTRERLDKIVQVIDVERPSERARFLEHIRSIGETEPTLFDQ